MKCPGRRHPAEAVMIPLFVVLEHPRPAELANSIERSEKPSIEHVLSIPSVEPLDVDILVRLTWLDVFDSERRGRSTATLAVSFSRG